MEAVRKEQKEKTELVHKLSHDTFLKYLQKVKPIYYSMMKKKIS